MDSNREGCGFEMGGMLWMKEASGSGMRNLFHVGYMTPVPNPYCAVTSGSRGWE